MKRSILFGLAVLTVVALSVTGCSKEKARAKTISKAFFEDLMEGNYTSATRFVHDDDTTSLYENWQDMAGMVKGAEDWSMDVELTSKTKGKAVCTAEFGKGKDKKEVSVSVDLRRKDGDWWVRVAPNPRALEARAQKIQDAKDAKAKAEGLAKAAEAAAEAKAAGEKPKEAVAAPEKPAAEVAKPAEAAKPAEETKPAEAAKPAEEAKPAAEAAPAEEVKPAEAAKPAEATPPAEPAADKPPEF